jgi:hypothetical protein
MHAVAPPLVTGPQVGAPNVSTCVFDDCASERGARRPFLLAGKADPQARHPLSPTACINLSNIEIAKFWADLQKGCMLVMTHGNLQTWPLCPVFGHATVTCGHPRSAPLSRDKPPLFFAPHWQLRRWWGVPHMGGPLRTKQFPHTPNQRTSHMNVHRLRHGLPVGHPLVPLCSSGASQTVALGRLGTETCRTMPEIS